MLKLKAITKDYLAGATTVRALQGIDIEFRKNEFVSILGPSGCGKTTLLNIIGGLDRYTRGDLTINGKSTKDFKDSDWDAYRNHSIGFVFQTYNLIPHQTVLSNVELALTLSGVSKAERRERATAVLTQVGLADQLQKRPNQLSGGQMQRVAIARALINDPDILLADEPTGALDTETSTQVMDILRTVAKDRLVIMVTHNPDLAQQYSTRIVRLLDGKLVSDSNPYDSAQPTSSVPEQTKVTRLSMSMVTALSLSLNNLLTKKARTLLTAFAGSIGIIGIALILSLSSGFQNYISKVEEDTLSSYPITIERETVDFTSMMASVENMRGRRKIQHELDGVYVNPVMTDMLSLMISRSTTNDLVAFKSYMEQHQDELQQYVTAVSYSYNVDLNVYASDYSTGILQVNPSTVFDAMTPDNRRQRTPMARMKVWDEMLDNPALLASQYEVLAGRWPQQFNEIVLIVDKNHEISDVALYSLGLADSSGLPEVFAAVAQGKKMELPQMSFGYDDLLGHTFKLVLNTDYYAYDESTGVWQDRRDDENYMRGVLDRAVELRVTGILRAADASVGASINGSMGYTTALTAYIIRATNEAEIVTAQVAAPDVNVLSGLRFGKPEGTIVDGMLLAASGMSDDQSAYLATMSADELTALGQGTDQVASGSAPSNLPADSYAGVLALLGVVDVDRPNAINIYAADFKAKEHINDFITGYNRMRTDAGEEQFVINYTDYIAMMMSSVTSIISTISYVLIAFVAISLVVSSIMIGIITYISVLERTKEIGVLRSIGASKRDISRVFNAETMIVGFVSGSIGIFVAVILCIPINFVINRLADIPNVAGLPTGSAIILVAISVLLTLTAGLIPSRIAAKKDPVVALRTE